MDNKKQAKLTTHKRFKKLVDKKLEELEELDNEAEVYFLYKRLRYLLRYNNTETVINHLDKVSDELYKLFRLYDK